MLIEITMLPPTIQEQILTVKQGNVVQFAYNGEVIANVTKEPTLKSNQLIGGDKTFGLWRGRNIDGVDYQNQIRSEWDREWD